MGEGRWRPPRRLRAVRGLDLDAARALIGNLYEPTALHVAADARFQMSLESYRLDQVTVGRLACNERVRMTTSVSNYHVILPLTGVMHAHTGDRRSYLCGPGRATVFSPGQQAATSWSGGGTTLAVMIPKALLERTGQRLMEGRAPEVVSFGPVLQLGVQGAAGWRDVLWLLQREFERGEVLSDHPVVARHLEALLLDALLLSEASVQRELLLGEDRSACTGTVRRAMQMIDEDPRAGWSTTRLAAALHVGVRSLQEGFRSAAGESPMAYVRGARLEGARRTLRESSPEETTVQAVAAAWGFAHMGRFAGAYKERFGESPSATLRGK